MTQPDSPPPVPAAAGATDAATDAPDTGADDIGAGSAAPALSRGQRKKAKLKAKKAEATKEERTAPLEPSSSASSAPANASPAPPPPQLKASASAGDDEKQRKVDEDADDGDSDDGDAAADTSAEGEARKKKKKKKKKGKTSALTASSTSSSSSSSSWASATIRCIPFYLASPPYNAAGVRPSKPQTSPPTISVSSLYPAHNYPEGQLLTYPLVTNSHRTGSEEKRALDRVNESLYTEVREAAEVHRQVRQDFQRWVRPGTSMLDIAHYIERGTRTLVRADGVARGWGFPTGLSLNHCAAHYTPNSKDSTVLQASDVMKVDIGVQVNGHIVDCAFTVAFDERYDPLIRTVKDATDAGIRAAGIDVRLCDIGEAVQEVMEAGEVELDGKVHRIKSIKNLNGHSIGRYQIHAGKSIPIIKNQDTTKYTPHTHAHATDSHTHTHHRISPQNSSTAVHIHSPSPVPLRRLVCATA